ncbi:hypothetical protein LQR31_10490 [Chromobacterium vaccinii]|uniref:hypothetical protein n=1 Tax=Chromobacterium vaccinii TaxID=1108595 RepID=UPI001E5C6E35|nr:hypothetical protein [Chromobacterium vaccinii]MCD4484901.1 hypothetical protein [Chromobacterium vaccinii]
MTRPLIIDTNLLLLLIIGAVEDRRHIKNSRRLKDYNEDDYYAILEIFKRYDRILITPYIATEISNLIDLRDDVKTSVMNFAREFFSKCEEIKSSINVDCEDDFFLSFGITDNSLIRLVRDYNVLTNDGRMAPLLYSVNPHNVIHYDLIRKR